MTTSMKIAQKELKTAFHSVTTYIIFMIFLILAGIYFSSTVFKVAKADLRGLFEIMHLLFIFYIPALTMGTISKEKSAGTLELISTMPIRLGHFIFGKFLSVIGLILVAIVFTAVFPVIIIIFGTGIDYGALLGGYIGLIIIGATYTAIGIFASSLQNNHTLSFIIAGVLSALFYVTKYILEFAPRQLIGILQYISFDYHYQNFLKGIIDTRDLLFFFGIIAIFLMLAETNLRTKNLMQER